MLVCGSRSTLLRVAAAIATLLGAASIIALRLIVATAVSTLLRVSTTTTALLLIVRVWVFKGALASLSVDEDVALLSLIPL